MNRQIRRMCEYLGYEVLKLQRTRIMNVNLVGLGIGQWRELTEKELLEINAMVATSSKTEEASIVIEKPQRKPNEFNKKSATFRKNSPKSKKNSSASQRKRRY